MCPKLRAAARFLGAVLVVTSFCGTLFAQQTLQITTPSPLPPGVAGAFYSFSLQASGSSPVLWGLVSGVIPPNLTLTQTGSLIGNLAVPGTYVFTVQAVCCNPIQTDTRTFQITVHPALAIATTTLPDATLATSYSASLTASGGLPPYRWTNVGGPLPPGLSLTEAGILSGTPMSLGNFTLTLRVSDSFAPVNEVNRTFTLAIVRPLTINTLSLPNAILNLDYSRQLQAEGGTPPFTWLVTSGTLPAELKLTTDGLLQGTPKVVGSESFTVTVTDSRGMAASRNFTLVTDPEVSSLFVPNLPTTLNPRQVTDVALFLSAPHPSPLSGELTLTFESSAEVPSDDPMTQFSTGSRVVRFTIPANSTAAVFPSRIMLLTGTVTGTVKLTASVENGRSDIPVATVGISATPPQIANIRTARTSNGFEVRITGYAPMRRVTSIEFTFAVRSGNSTVEITLGRDVEVEFGNWYRNAASTAFGSAFSFIQSFTVQGDADSIETVTVRLTNVQGSTSSSPIPLP
jgi:hypothetical protein